ncbi:hypothetical protein PTE30175_04562 [Pandoraea terrae]|uniref:Uncharacterized protein n=1 Tax=Pandoraea terrae TaxID=1537710 RepID=A0A5E4YQR2_9BURK|nr:hypothetical protein [Pandoraea terrae]VVE50590.1 hypothetical protein PTE30175_04562 [Pandoraea terrae]
MTGKGKGAFYGGFLAVLFRLRNNAGIRFPRAFGGLAPAKGAPAQGAYHDPGGNFADTAFHIVKYRSQEADDVVRPLDYRN